MNKAKVLITGANGLLGQHLVEKLLCHGYAVIAAGRGSPRLPFAPSAAFSYVSLDLRDAAGWEKIFDAARPGVVVHAAAMTQVDDCESEREACFATNVEGTERILSLAEEFSGFFLFLSTDFVFDGLRGNYSEEDATNAVNWYGQTKIMAESRVSASQIPWAIVRTCLVYGPTPPGGRNNIVSWVQSSLERKERIRVVDDQSRTPTYVGDLSEGILRILDRKATGIFHISGKDLLTPYEMAVKTAIRCGLDASLIERVNGKVFSQAGKRPAKTGFSIGKARRELQYEPRGFEEALELICPPK